MAIFNKDRAVDAYQDSSFIRITSWMLFIGLFAALITVAIVNIKPYTLVMASATANASWIHEIPLIGTVFKSLSIGVEYIAAILVWVPIQILECMWLVIALDAKAQKASLRQAASLSKDLQEARRGGPESRAAARRISRIPFFFTKWAAMLSLGAYTFDLVVGLQAYPVWKDWSSFEMWAKSMNNIWINFANLQDLIVMMFSFEAVLILVLIVWQWVGFRKDGASDA